MAHWAELDQNNIVLRVTVGNNEHVDEGYQWLLDNHGGTWLKTSYNTIQGIHLLDGTPFRGNYAGKGFTYYLDIDAFMPPKEFESWVIDTETYSWIPPVSKPDSGIWEWDEETVSWVEQDPK